MLVAVNWTWAGRNFISPTRTCTSSSSWISRRRLLYPLQTRLDIHVLENVDDYSSLWFRLPMFLSKGQWNKSHLKAKSKYFQGIKSGYFILVMVFKPTHWPSLAHREDVDVYKLYCHMYMCWKLLVFTGYYALCICAGNCWCSQGIMPRAPARDIG
jgi:hypothetical protein